MHIINRTISIEGSHLACLIFLPENLTEQTNGDNKIKAMVIACHGFRGGKENGGRVNSLAHKLNNAGFGLLAFDFRGSGESSGCFTQMTISSQAADLRQIIAWTEHTYKVPVIALGRSLGGSTVLAAMGLGSRPVASVLWSTPIDVRNTFTRLLGDTAQQLAAGQTASLHDDYSSYELGPDFWYDLCQHDFESYLLMAGNSPLLAVYGEADEVVDSANGLKLKTMVPNTQMIMVPKADHKFINGWELREDFTVAWLNYLFS